MDIQRCFKILELHRNASLDEAKQAYKDLVSIWHPDRFSSNPRLRQKAEEKLKEINTAYETVKSYLSSDGKRGHEQQKGAKANGEAEPDKAYRRTEAGDRTEAIAESATRFVLTALSYFSAAVRRFMAQVDEAKVEAGKEERESRLRQEKRGGGGKGKGARSGKGKGMNGGRDGKSRGKTSR
ncbi:MAG: DnaJ domain-containing protein [Desulfobacteraceae bacterium]|jgi:curved DNA-binding protein CbpA